MSDYLWDKEGEPDPEVEQLEVLLGPLRYRGRAPLPPPRRRRAVYVAILATALAAVVAILALRIAPPKAPKDAQLASAAGWSAQVTGGTARAGERSITGTTQLPVGEWLETDASAVRITVATIGTVELGPQSRARIVETSPVHHELELVRGRLVAQIDAPARTFIVRTPHVIAIDLGCAFALELDAQGRGRLVVTGGSVALADGKTREVTVEAGAECGITESGPGTPTYSDASPAFREALDRYPRDRSALATILGEARTRDQRTLELLLVGARTEDRSRLERKLGELSGGVRTTPTQAPKHERRHETRHEPTATPTPSRPTQVTPAPSRPTQVTPAVKPPQVTPAVKPPQKPDRGQKLEHDPFRSVD